MKRSMWQFLGHAVLNRLKSPAEKHKYQDVINDVELRLITGRISGHEAA